MRIKNGGLGYLRITGIECLQPYFLQEREREDYYET